MGTRSRGCIRARILWTKGDMEVILTRHRRQRGHGLGWRGELVPTAMLFLFPTTLGYRRWLSPSRMMVRIPSRSILLDRCLPQHPRPSSRFLRRRLSTLPTTTMARAVIPVVVRPWCMMVSRGAVSQPQQQQQHQEDWKRQQAGVMPMFSTFQHRASLCLK